MSIKTTDIEQGLVALLQQKDNQAFSYLYDYYAGTLYGIIKQVVGNEELVSNVVQKVFVSIWQKIHCYDPVKERLFT